LQYSRSDDACEMVARRTGPNASEYRRADTETTVSQIR
jgi:hypothetical protein